MLFLRVDDLAVLQELFSQLLLDQRTWRKIHLFLELVDVLRKSLLCRKMFLDSIFFCVRTLRQASLHFLLWSEMNCEQNTLTRHIFSFLSALMIMSHTTLAQGVSARHTIHVSCPVCLISLRPSLRILHLSLPSSTSSSWSFTWSSIFREWGVWPFGQQRSPHRLWAQLLRRVPLLRDHRNFHPGVFQRQQALVLAWHPCRVRPSHRSWAQRLKKKRRLLNHTPRNPRSRLGPRMTSSTMTSPSAERSLYHCTLRSEKNQRAVDKLITLLTNVCCQVSRCLSVMYARGDLLMSLVR